MYSIYSFGKMVGDKIRTDAYVEALRQVVAEDSIVLDIGTGTGIFAMIACQLGARQVYAIEPSAAISVARETAALNNMQNKITFIQKMSTDVSLPEKATVMVSDLRGKVPLFNRHIISVIDARERLLSPDGIQIPQQDKIWVALICAPDIYKEAVTPWEGNTYNLNLEPSSKYLVNRWLERRLEKEHLATEGQLWATIDYCNISKPNVSGELHWKIENARTVHGMTMWFDGFLAPGISYSTNPCQPQLIYGNSFIPWSRPVDLNVGDEVVMQIKANLVGDYYVWRWNTQIFDQEQPHKARINFKQSSLFSEPISVERLSRRDLAHKPALGKKGQMTQIILNLMDGQATVQEIANHLFAQYPEYYKDQSDVLESVRNISQEFSD